MLHYKPSPNPVAYKKGKQTFVSPSGVCGSARALLDSRLRAELKSAAQYSYASQGLLLSWGRTASLGGEETPGLS